MKLFDKAWVMLEVKARVKNQITIAFLWVKWCWSLFYKDLIDQIDWLVFLVKIKISLRIKPKIRKELGEKQLVQWLFLGMKN